MREWARRLARRAVRLTAEWHGGGPPAAGPIDVIDLFCGCGGLSAGFEIVGRLVPSYRLAGAVDVDPRATATYAANLPLVPVLADLGTATADRRSLAALAKALRLRNGAPLVLVAGPPCQGFSAHRKKQGLVRDGRNGLIGSFARAAVFLKPDFVVLENVPELLAKRHWTRFAELRDALEAAGYVVKAHIHNLAGFGVAQVRYRALVIAARQSFAMPEPFLSIEDFRTVRDVIERLPPVSPGVPDQFDPMHCCTRHRPTTLRTIRRVPHDGGTRPRGVGPRCLDRVDGFRDVYGRLYWDRPANTITAYARNPASGRYVHPEQDRGLTVREAALLQGFPLNYSFSGPFDHRFVQIGNAVPPIFAAYLAAHVLGELFGGPLSDALPSTASRGIEITAPTSNSFSSGIAGRKRRLALS